MDQLIEQIEGVPFSGEDVLLVTDRKTKIYRYKDLKKFRTLDQALSPHGCFVILYETRPSYGHWVCVIKHKPMRGKPYVEFFDSYGMAPDRQLEFIPPTFRRQNDEAYPILTKLLHESGYEVVYNPHPLQESIDDVATCGRHISFRIVMRRHPLNHYLQLMTSSRYTPDELVTMLTAFV